MSDLERPYGFVWGNMVVERLSQIEGQGRVLAVYVKGKSRNEGLEIYLSEGGRSLRVWYRGRELK